MDISICIVAYNACDYLRACLQSIVQYPPVAEYEIIVVDNGSQDGTGQMLQDEFPQVRLIQNDVNRGFTVSLNQAMHSAKGVLLVSLNPDTLLTTDVFNTLRKFMQTHPEVGIVTPKVLNSDGSFQKQCRRGEARPLEVFAYFLKLDRLWPKSKTFGAYLLTYLPEDEIAEVKAVSGSCMIIRRELIEQVGYFDERYFAYQEDSDFCFQARQAGWKVYYVPATTIVHYGGQGGSGTRPFHGVYQWHRSYYLYYRKNLASDYFFLFNWFYYELMVIKLLWAMIVTVFRRKKIVGTPKP